MQTLPMPITHLLISRPQKMPEIQMQQQQTIHQPMLLRAAVIIPEVQRQTPEDLQMSSCLIQMRQEHCIVTLMDMHLLSSRMETETGLTLTVMFIHSQMR